MRSTWQAWSYLIILAAGKMLRKTAGESSSAIETWLAGKSIWNGGLNGKSILNWVRFHCNVWLPEGTEWVWSKMLCTGRRSYTTRPDTKRSDTSQKLRCTLNLQGDPFKSGRNNSQAHGSWHVLLLTFGDHLQTSSDSRNSKAASMTVPMLLAQCARAEIFRALGLPMASRLLRSWAGELVAMEHGGCLQKPLELSNQPWRVDQKVRISEYQGSMHQKTCPSLEFASQRGICAQRCPGF